ncbi:MAG: hypothetical protein ABWY52_04965, partial [Candidatus Limnocylindrales bacterium]
VVVAGQAVAAGPSSGPGDASVRDADGTADDVDTGDPVDGAQPDPVVTPLMGAAGAGAVIAMMLAATAAGARLRRWRTDRLVSRGATERLQKLMSVTQEEAHIP